MSPPARILISASILALLFLLVHFSSYAASPGDVVINEVMWMGSSVSTADEWLELWNTTDQDIDVSGWQLTKKSGDSEVLMLEIPPEVTIAARGYFLISNNDGGHVFTNGESVLNVKPDLIDTSVSLANTKLQIKLYDGPWDGGGNLIDTADDGVGAPAAGDNSTKASMARKDPSEDGANPDSWYTSTAAVGFDVGATEKGTPGSENIDALEEEEEKEVTYSAQFFLNEIMPNPVGDDENEYLELYNASDEEVDLKNWVLKDLTGDRIIGPEASPSSTLISAKGFLVIYRKDGSVSLNNGGDTIQLLNPNDEIVDEVSYPEIDEGWVYQRYPDGNSSWSESNEPTAGAANKPSSSSTSDSSGSSDPEVSFSVSGSDLKVNQSFDVKVGIKNATPRHDYYVKVRLGLEESKLTDGRTYNSFFDDWLADNASWSKFPVVYTASDGTESITVSAKVASGNSAGTHIIGVRLRDEGAEKNYDSETQTITVGAEEVLESSDGESEDGGTVLGALTELPATGANPTNSGFLSLALGLFLRIITKSYILICDRK